MKEKKIFNTPIGRFFSYFVRENVTVRSPTAHVVQRCDITKIRFFFSFFFGLHRFILPINGKCVTVHNISPFQGKSENFLLSTNLTNNKKAILLLYYIILLFFFSISHVCLHIEIKHIIIDKSKVNEPVHSYWYKKKL